MFGGISSLFQPSSVVSPPKKVDAPTPVRLPSYDGSSTVSDASPKLAASKEYSSLAHQLQTLCRPNDLDGSYFAALGVRMHSDAPAEDVHPEPSYLPVASDWDQLSIDEARTKDHGFRRPLSNGKLSPEAWTYLERRNELAINNQTAFRTVRRMPPPRGARPARLGNGYEFFRQLEMVAGFWDDTSLPPLPVQEEGDAGEDEAMAPPLPPRPRPADTRLEAEAPAIANVVTVPNPVSPAGAQPEPERVAYRSAAGNTMPPEYRHNLISAFVKMVAYDFGCSVSLPRVEPRLYVGGTPTSSSLDRHGEVADPPPNKSYFPSSCAFTWRLPITRETARSGILDGPICAVSARNTTTFGPQDEIIDFGREVVAALAAAQLRAREGQFERRFGEGQWWTTAKRWGGGEGGPIGREVNLDEVIGDKDAPVAAAVGAAEPDVAQAIASSASVPNSGETSAEALKRLLKSGGGKGGEEPLNKATGLPVPVRGAPPPKKNRKTLSIYDNYRMIRLPSSNWDRKARYEALGRRRGADYDDVFVISSLFHHVCVMRVRVPDRLLDAIDGAPAGAGAGTATGQPRSSDSSSSSSIWGGELEMWRSRWFDLFLIQDRLDAMRLLWGVMAWMMREKEKDESSTRIVIS